MKTLKVKRNNGNVELSGNGIFEIKNKVQKYGFKFDWNTKIWTGTEDQFKIVKKYIGNFKSSVVEIVEL